jgi:hypothetical protein
MQCRNSAGRRKPLLKYPGRMPLRDGHPRWKSLEKTCCFKRITVYLLRGQVALLARAEREDSEMQPSICTRRVYRLFIQTKPRAQPLQHHEYAALKGRIRL